MNKRTIFAAAIMAAAPMLAQADDLKGKWSLSVAAGTALELSGDVHTAGSGTVLDLATAVEARSYGDIYDPGFLGQASLGYGVSEKAEVFVRGSYYTMSSNVVRVGNVAGLDLFGQWSDYKEWGGDIGVRYFFNRASKAKPYLAPSVGFRSLSENPATFTVPAANVTLADVPFYDSSTVLGAGADLGVVVDLSERVGLGFETGLRWHSKPSRRNGLAGTGLESINDTGSRLSLPVSVNVRFSF